MAPPQSLCTLLAGAIDYAGLFPPASLSIDAAVASWRAYRADDAAWMLGRFVCPRTQLAELVRLEWTERDGPISLIVAGDVDLRTFTYPAWVDAIETTSSESDATIAATIYFERSTKGLSDELAAMAARGSNGCLKFRTGGTKADAFPSSGDLASVIALIRDAGVPWKATAGLHHPLPNIDACGGRAHGFLNLLVATVLAHARRLNVSAIQAILENEDPPNFRFDDDKLAWGDYTASVAEIAASRRDSFRSFGSCSFIEPRDDLTALNWFAG